MAKGYLSLLLLLILITGRAAAQPVLTRTNIGPNLNDTIVWRYASTIIAIPNGGDNVIWDYSSVVDDGTNDFEYSCEDTIAADIHIQVQDANMIYVTPGNTTYLRINDSGLFILAYGWYSM